MSYPQWAWPSLSPEANGQQVISSLNRHLKVLQAKLAENDRAFTVDSSGNVSFSGWISGETIYVATSDDPSNEDFRLRIDVSTNGQIEIVTEEYDSSEGAWFESGEEKIADPDEITFRFAEYLGSGSGAFHDSHLYNKNEYIFSNALGFDDAVGSPSPFAALSDGDATPDVAGRVCWRTANTSATTITAFDHAQDANDRKHFFLLLVDDNFTSLDFSASGISGAASGVVKLVSGDLLLCVRRGGTGATTQVLYGHVAGPRLISEASAAGDTVIDFTLPGGFGEYEVRLRNVVLDTDGNELRMRVSTDGGSTFRGSTGDYTWVVRANDSAGTAQHDVATSGTVIALSSNDAGEQLGSDANENGLSAVIRIVRPDAAEHTAIYWTGHLWNEDGEIVTLHGAAATLDAEDVDAIRFLVASGVEIESGDFQLWGIP